MTGLSEGDIRYLKYQIYSFKYDNPWISNKKIAELVNRSVSTVEKYAKKAEEEMIIPNPQIRLNSPSKKAALLLFEDKWRAYNELQEYKDITYLSVYQGDWDITAVYNGFVDFSQVSGYKKKIMEGLRGRIFTQKAKNTTWRSCFADMETLLEQKKIEESTIEFTPCYPNWNDDHWKMFNYFKLNIGKEFCHLSKEYPISWRCFEEWKKDLREFCTVITYYFPEGYQAYDIYTHCFKTDYEKYIITLFSTLPTSSVFHKVGDYLFVNIFVPSDYEQQMRIYDVISRLLNKEIITDHMDGNRIVYWRCRKEKPIVDSKKIGISLDADKMTNKLFSLNPEEFEHFCSEIMDLLDLRNINWQRGGSDRGADIMGEYLLEFPLINKQRKEFWVIQCKRHKRSITLSESLRRTLDFAKNNKAHCIVFITTSYFTRTVKDWFESIERDDRIHVLHLENSDLERVITKYPDRFSSFLGDKKSIYFISQLKIRDLRPAIRIISIFVREIGEGKQRISSEEIMEICSKYGFSKDEILAGLSAAEKEGLMQICEFENDAKMYFLDARVCNIVKQFNKMIYWGDQ